MAALRISACPWQCGRSVAYGVARTDADVWREYQHRDGPLSAGRDNRSAGSMPEQNKMIGRGRLGHPERSTGARMTRHDLSDWPLSAGSWQLKHFRRIKIG